MRTVSCGYYTLQQTDNNCFDIAHQINRNAIESFFFIKFELNFSSSNYMYNEMSCTF